MLPPVLRLVNKKRFLRVPKKLTPVTFTASGTAPVRTQVAVRQFVQRKLGTSFMASQVSSADEGSLKDTNRPKLSEPSFRFSSTLSAWLKYSSVPAVAKYLFYAPSITSSSVHSDDVMS